MSEEMASGGDGQPGVNLLDTEKFDMIAKGIEPMESAGGMGQNFNPTALEALFREVPWFEVQLIVAQGAFVRILVVRSMCDTIVAYLVIRDHKRFLGE
jgi:hypothetical protein